jgi:hypothetical protein
MSRNVNERGLDDLGIGVKWKVSCSGVEIVGNRRRVDTSDRIRGYDVIRQLGNPTERNNRVVEGSEDLAKNDESIGQKEAVAVGMCIIPTKVYSRFRRANVLEISIVESCSPKHSKRVGLHAADSTKREERVSWV